MQIKTAVLPLLAPFAREPGLIAFRLSRIVSIALADATDCRDGRGGYCDFPRAVTGHTASTLSLRTP
jgi:hypothetical protein